MYSSRKAQNFLWLALCRVNACTWFKMRLGHCLYSSAETGAKNRLRFLYCMSSALRYRKNSA